MPRRSSGQPDPRLSELVFPAPNGRMYSERSANFSAILRAGLVRANITTGYLHVCRRRGCAYREAAADDALRRYSVHGARLWPKPQVRPIRSDKQVAVEWARPQRGHHGGCTRRLGRSRVIRGPRGKTRNGEAEKPKDFVWLGSDSNRLPADYETAALTS